MHAAQEEIDAEVGDKYAQECHNAEPMACNLQLVFFRNKNKEDILVQVLLNGFEATLPLEMAAPGCFYRWDDIKKLYNFAA